jgi:anti-sigma regulatory factor (Ser/Thr protein kinase)
MAMMLDPDPAAELKLSLPAEPQAARLLRAELRAWLRRLGATGHETFDMLLASGEALANAIQHPLDRRLQMILFSAEHREDNVVITIRDFGRWQTERRRPGAGLGLQLMRSLTDKIEIAKTDSGTTITLCRRLGGRRNVAVRLGEYGLRP